ncbi:MAG TPA: DUF2911 domain-containing protein [Thermoanaerobaculia bacterium]|jgi:hypothetical protein|nr:DUF2911 domain-containing protein [Thermoanaerobaculia bacterium]
MRKLLTLAVLAALPIITTAQLKLPRPSPKQTITQSVGLTDITISYSRPGVKGRSIWGSLVPYGQVWRTGANEATTIQFSTDVTVGGKQLPAGTYSLHTIPGRDSWLIVLNSDTNLWGSFDFDPAKDLLRFEAKPEAAPFTEWLTFDFADPGPETAKIVLRWEKIAVPFQVMTGTSARAMANIQDALAKAAPDDWQTPYSAAGYAFDQGNIANATTWLDRSLATKQTMPALWLKARMQAKAGNKAEAMKTANAALALAGPNDKDFASEIRRLSALWK